MSDAVGQPSSSGISDKQAEFVSQEKLGFVTDDPCVCIYSAFLC